MDLLFIIFWTPPNDGGQYMGCHQLREHGTVQGYYKNKVKLSDDDDPELTVPSHWMAW